MFYAAEAARAKRPFYNFLAQGDSWFTYDCGFALINFLKGFFGPETTYFNNIARSGRTLRTMMSREFKDALLAGPGKGQPWSALLLSGGGNDMCGDHRFRDWLKPYDGGTSPEEYIATAFDNELAVIQGLYEEALDLVAKSTPGTLLFVHNYDFAIPDNRCVTGRSKRLRSDLHFCFAGPWLWLRLTIGGFTKRMDAVFHGCTISRNGPARFRINGPTLHGLPAEPRFESSTRPFSLTQVFEL